MCMGGRGEVTEREDTDISCVLRTGAEVLPGCMGNEGADGFKSIVASLSWHFGLSLCICSVLFAFSQLTLLIHHFYLPIVSTYL